MIKVLRLWFNFVAITACVLVFGIVGAVAYLRQPLFGALPHGERQQRIVGSPNYVDGAFMNQVATAMRTTDQSEWSMWVETICGGGGHPRPLGNLPVIKTNLKALDPNEDLIIWLGHSSYFVQLGGQRILIDPVFSTNASPIPFTNTAFEGTSIYSADDMPFIDLLLISHDHYDHLDYPTLRALAPKVKKLIAGLGVGTHLETWGYDMSTVHEADWYETVGVAANLQVHVTPARHFSGRLFTRDQSLWVGFALTSARHRLFFSGDSGYAPHFAEIGGRYGPFDWVALDAGQYDPRWANVHMNPEEAAQAASDLRARVLMPSHVGRFSIAPHDWDDPFKRIVLASRARDYFLWTPKIGQVMNLNGHPQQFPAWWSS